MSRLSGPYTEFAVELSALHTSRFVSRCEENSPTCRPDSRQIGVAAFSVSLFMSAYESTRHKLLLADTVDRQSATMNRLIEKKLQQLPSICRPTNWPVLTVP